MNSRLCHHARVRIDVHAAEAFLAAHGRLLDRRRLQFWLGHHDASRVLAALDAYRNADGGYGWSLEPDLRSAGNQPAAAMHAFEVLTEVGPAAGARGGEGHAVLDVAAGDGNFAIAAARRGAARRLWLPTSHR